MPDAFGIVVGDDTLNSSPDWPLGAVRFAGECT